MALEPKPCVTAGVTGSPAAKRSRRVQAGWPRHSAFPCPMVVNGSSQPALTVHCFVPSVAQGAVGAAVPLRQSCVLAGADARRCGEGRAGRLSRRRRFIGPPLRRIAGVAGLSRLRQTVRPTLAPFRPPRLGHGGGAAERSERFATQRAQDDFGFTFRPQRCRGISRPELHSGLAGWAVRFVTS